MERTIRLLGLLLVAQLLLAAGLFYAGRGGSATNAGAATALLDFDTTGIDRILIAGPQGAEVALSRSEDGWRVPAPGGDFPAPAAKVNGLLDRLHGLARGSAVATTEGARERFEVAENKFERRIVLEAGGKEVGRLFVGTSPVMRKVHARAGDDAEIYLVEFAAHEAPATAAGWQDKDVLQLPADDISAIEIDGLRLERATAPTPAAEGEAGKPAAPRWHATGLADGETVREDAADRLAGLLANLRIGEVLGREKKPEYGLDKPALVLRLERAGGGSIEYRLGKEPGKEDGYTLKVSDRPEYFGLAYFTADPIVEAARRAALVGAAGSGG